MVFSTQTIIESSNRSFNKKEIKYQVNPESFFVESLDYILNENKEFNSLMITETKSTLINIDFKKIIKWILDKFMELLDKIWKQFKVVLVDFATDNSVIKKYKKQLETTENDIDFSETRYIYTNLGLNTSYSSLKIELEKEKSNLILALSNFDGSTYKSSTLYENLINMKEELSSDNNYLDIIRGKVVGSNESISKEEFAMKLFNYFRNDGIEISSGTILAKEIRKTCSDYFDYSKNIKLVEKDKSDMKSYSNKLKSDISSIKIDKILNYEGNLSNEISKVFNEILVIKSQRVKSICDLFLQLFGAKLDAIKDSQTQNTKILLKACKQIIKEG